MVTTLMPALGAAAATLWVAALVAAPRRPLPGNEVAELVYSRLLGRHQRLLLVAFAVTVAVAFALLVALSQQAGAAVSDRRAEMICPPSPAGLPTCYYAVPGGWQGEQMSEDGTWRITGSPVAALPLAEKDRSLDP